METPIKISYRWSLDEMLLLNRLHMRFSPQMRRATSNTGPIIFLCMGFICFLGMTVTRDKMRLFLWGASLVAVGTLFLTGTPFLIRRAVRKAYATKPDRDMVIDYEIFDDRLLGKTDVASSDILWRAIQKVHRTPMGFLLYVSNNQILWLPIHGFENPTGVDTLAQLAKEKVQDYNDAH